MALVTTKEMFEKALRSDYAVGAFNVNNMEIIQGIVDAAKIENAPLILQVSAGARKYAKPIYLVKLVEAAIEDSGLDICLHLDHGEDFDICKKCVDDGFTSVMIDGSKYPFEENIALTKQVVEYAHAKGVAVEAELGKLAGVEDNINVDARSATFTDPEEAAEFVERTCVDSLAVAIGTAHGVYKGTPKLDMERLSEIRKVVSVPLVLHGTSGVPDDAVRECVARGMCKVNYATDLRIAFSKGLKEYLAKDPEVFDPKKYSAVGREYVKEYVKSKILVCGSNGKA